MKAVGIVMAGGNSERLKSLCSMRAISAMPIASTFRAIDFSLSNMSNSGIKKVAVITQYNSRSLHDHLSSAKWWDLGRKQGGLFIFTPFLSNENSFWFRGTADSIYQNISFLKKSIEPYVVITSGDAIYKMDFRNVLKYHEEKDADITVICKDLANTNKDVRDFGVMEFDENMRMTDFEEKPIDPTSTIASLGMYVIKRSLLIKLLGSTVPEGRYDLVKDILIRYRKQLNIYGYKFEGYWNTLNSVNAYMDTNMDFLKKEVRDMLCVPPFITTKVKDEPPVKYNYNADVSNSLLGSGSIVNGTVKDSVIFRNVFVGEESSVKGSLVLEGSYIAKNCTIENAIIDKEVVIGEGKQIIGEPGNPVVISKGSIV